MFLPHGNSLTSHPPIVFWPWECNYFALNICSVSRVSVEHVTLSLALTTALLPQPYPSLLLTLHGQQLQHFKINIPIFQLQLTLVYGRTGPGRAGPKPLSAPVP